MYFNSRNSFYNIVKHVAKRDEEGYPYTVIAVAEGAKYADGTKVIGKIVEDSPDPIRLGGIAAKVADDLEKAIPNHEVRSVNPDISFVVVTFNHMIEFYQFVLELRH